MVIKIVISETFDAPVWRMQIDEQKDVLIAEIRDVVNKQVSFSSISLNPAVVNFKDLGFHDRWLTGLEAAKDGVILLHGFQSDILPLHKGLFGIDSHSGEMLWADYNLTFERVADDGIIASDSRIQPKKLFKIDHKTGQRVEDVTHVEYFNSQIRVPELIPADKLPAHLKPLTPEGNMAHYLRHNDFEIVSLHALNRDKLHQFLFIWDRGHNLVFEDIINDDIQKLQPEAFINYKNQLIWLKNRNNLKVINLY
ncbi:DUF4905 domain-containing protein [Mucilaginibacter sp. KACC 22063]|uniref:DUF4905 domain-containing protein n=1 Tax=Mucilaginibacter sp. KACC 22063 TaxID=3025666 RepID=UPI002366FA15|nr:DUF4905 domain-containing protein [Mucilaginibacter sp. KACC 22063]WDF53712.1 DUF4905 domain-containing protein [Mucilaginibacter sp. KACC 22063]